MATESHVQSCEMVFGVHVPLDPSAWDVSFSVSTVCANNQG